MEKSLIICGSGGQGILLSGTVLCNAAIEEGKIVTWFPNYTAEKRGGKAFCTVVISENEIASPTVKNPDILLGLDNAGYDIYESSIKPGGTVIINSSLIKREIAPVKDVKFFKEPFNETANLLGNNKIMNMVAAGYLSAVTGFIKKESITASIRKIVAKKYEDLIDINIKAVEEGFKKGRKV